MDGLDDLDVATDVATQPEAMCLAHGFRPRPACLRPPRQACTPVTAKNADDKRTGEPSVCVPQDRLGSAEPTSAEHEEYPLQPFIEGLGYVNACAALLLAIVAALGAKQGGRPGRWGAAAFVALAVVLLILALDAEDRPDYETKVVLALLVAFPYLLLRFAASFGSVSARYARLAFVGAAVFVLVTAALPAFPADDDASPPAWVNVYLFGLLAFWLVLSFATIVALWRGGTGQPTLTRRRARLMSAAVAGMNLLLALAAVAPTGTQGDLIVQGLLLLALGAFAVGFAPPSFVRLAWRQPEQNALRRATERLVEATRVPEVTDALLPHVACVVGGSGAALLDDAGAIVASWGAVPEAGESAAVEVVPLTPPFGSLVVATGPLTPFFGREEVGLLHGLGALADLSLARCALAEREDESRHALHRAMDEAERANMAKSDFLSRMSHELRTPLNVVLGFGQILEMRASLEPREREAVDHILKAGRHLLELINEVLDLARIESGRMTISPEPVDLGELVGEALDLIRPLAAERSITLEAKLAAGNHHVIADRQRLKQVLLNLYSNAVKYNRDGGEVVVSGADGAPGMMRLDVRDTGPGVPAGLVDRLFQPFERLGAESGRVEGTGLGLALSRQLVELMGGEIGVESQEGIGSVFWVELALAQPLDTNGSALTGASAEHAELVRPSGRRRLLLIEDNLANLKVVESLLSGREHVELLAAMTGRLGVELAREHRPDVILLDQHLPDITGVEVLHRLRADPATRAIPVVIVSADATEGQIRRMRAIGAADYMTKPLDLTRFLRLIDGLLERRLTEAAT